MSWIDMLGSTLKDMGKTAYAMPGLAFDLSRSLVPGSAVDGPGVAQSFGNFVGRSTSLLTDADSATGYVAQPVMKAADWLGNNVIDEPLSTAALVASSMGNDPSAAFNGKLWSQAYQIAQDPRVTAGRTFANMGSDVNPDTGDPLQNLALIKGDLFHKIEDPWGEHKVFNLTSGTLDVAKSWYLDPTVVAGKAAAAARTAAVLRPIKVGEDVDKFVNGSRTEKVVGWVIDGKKSGTEIHDAIPALKASPDGAAIAHLLGETNKIDDPIKQADALREILKVTYGDQATIGNLRKQSAELADQMDNLTKQRTAFATQLKGLKTGTFADFDQVYSADRADYLRQMNDITEVVDALAARRAAVTKLVGDKVVLEDGSTPHLGGVDYKMSDRTASVGLKNPLTGTTTADRDLAAAKRDFIPKWAGAGVYQNGLTGKAVLLMDIAVPVRPAARLVGMMKQRQATGVANLFDTEKTSYELESYMRQAGLSYEERAPHLEAVAAASGSTDRLLVAQQAQQASLEKIAGKYGISAGEAQDFIAKGLAKQKRAHAGYQENVFSAATDKDGNAVDLFPDENGLMIHMPTISGQEVKNLTLLRTDEFERTLARNKDIIKGFNREKGDHAADLESMKAELPVVEKKIADAGDNVTDALINERDALKKNIDEHGSVAVPTPEYTKPDHLKDIGIDMANLFNRSWKMTTLLRPGYMVRVLADDQLREIAKLNGVGYALQAARGAKNGIVNLRHLDLLDVKKLDAHVEIQRQVDEMNTILAAAPDASGLDRMTKRATMRKRDNLQKQLDKGQNLWGKATAPIRAGEEGKARQVSQPFALDSTGQMMPAAAPAGQVGEIRLAQTSASEQLSRLVLDGADTSYAQIAGTPVSWVKIGPSDPGHAEAWLHAVNNQMMLGSPEVRYAVKNDWDRQDLTDFLRTTQGRDLRKQIGVLGQDAEDLSNRVMTHIEQYLPGELRNIARDKGRITNADILKHTEPQDRPIVHGAQLDYNLGRGPAAMMLNRSVNRIMTFMSETSTDNLSRHPLFGTMYRYHANRQADMMLAQVKRLEGRDTLTGDELNQIANTSASKARKNLQDTLFDLSAHSHGGQVMRFISPFVNAWQEAMTKWWNLAKDNPAGIAHIYQVWDAPNRVGLVVDSNGNPVPRGSGIGDNQYILTNWMKGMPGVGKWAPTALSKSSLNIVLQGNPVWLPGFGPLVAVPGYEVFKDDPAAAENAKFLFPFGIPNDLASNVTPSHVKKLTDWIDSWTSGKDEAYQTILAVQMADLRTQWQKAGANPADEPTWKQAQGNARGLMASRFFSQTLSGFSWKFDSKYQPFIDGYRHLEDDGFKRAAAGEIDPATKKPIQPKTWALDQFVKTYGREYIYLTGDRSLNNGGLPSTVAAASAIKKYSDTIGGMADPAFMAKFVIGPEIGDGAFSHEAYRWQRSQEISPGSTETYRSTSDAPAALKAQQANIGWFDYDKVMNAIRATASANNLTSYQDSPQLVAIRKAIIENLKAKNPVWREEFTTFSPEKFDIKLEDFRKLAADPRFKGDTGRTDIATLQKYLQIRDAFAQTLKVNKLTPQAQAAQPLLAAYTRMVMKLDDTRFTQYFFDRYLDRDPMLIDNIVQGVTP